MRNLVIVESPTKAKTLRKILSKGFSIKASMGHIADLPKKNLGVDINNNFSPTYLQLEKKKNVIDELVKAAHKANKIFLAPDPDREGEAIAWHIHRIVYRPGVEIKRVTFHEITQNAVLQAFKHPGKLDIQKVNAQQARRILDRLVGYKVSPLLWKKVKRGLSAGRVQSVALRLICEREREIQAFEPEEYWTIKSLLKADLPPQFSALLTKKNNEKLSIKNKEQAQNLYKDIIDRKFIVSKIISRERSKRPAPPYITSTLQQEAYREFRFPAKKTMMLAQRLYEGKNIGGEGHVGLITYMRTDSVRINDNFIGSVRNLIKNHFGENFLPKNSTQFKNKNNAQDAHEAIRPTDISRLPESLNSFLNQDELQLYTLIWKKTLASQMKPAVFAHTTVFISAGPFTFISRGKTTVFEGFLAVYKKNAANKILKTQYSDKKEIILPPLKKGEEVTLIKLEPKQQFTQPPPRYTEATLIKTLEKNGIGRPSTYAAIIEKIRSRDYTFVEKGYFIPTELGFIVIDLLIKNFKELFSVSFTAQMEKKLDKIESGIQNWQETIAEFYFPFEKELQAAIKNQVRITLKTAGTENVFYKAEKNQYKRDFNANSGKKWTNNQNINAYKPEKNSFKNDFVKQKGNAFPIKKNLKIMKQNSINEVNEFDIVCPNCGSKLVKRKGKNGEFLACPRFPECRYTRPIPKSLKKINTNDKRSIKKSHGNGKNIDKNSKICPECGQPLVLRKGSHGKFWGCSGFPDCTYTEPLSTNIPCTKKNCKGYFVKRKSKNGNIFYGCSSYPKCTNIVWHKPVEKKCPRCGNLFAMEDKKKEGIVSFTCLAEDCHHKWQERF